MKSLRPVGNPDVQGVRQCERLINQSRFADPGWSGDEPGLPVTQSICQQVQFALAGNQR
jgi:hypothetical protein